MPRHVIVGTAGHIDHGKTSLVKALTGIDADRLVEEKRRGITIDLGFADVQIGETHFAFIDGPGHEKFVRNMLAGIGGIDLVLLVVAADEGVKPQTREHFDICRLLGIQHGVIALTKADAASPDQITSAQAQVRELSSKSFLADAPVVRVSAIAGLGLEDLRRALWNVAQKIGERAASGVMRLPIDRVFTMKGFGTVVTGTLLTGSIRPEQELQLHPGGKRMRVRNVQVHGKSTSLAASGQRTAVNLAGVEKSDLDRGMMLAEPGLLRSTAMLDAELILLDAKPSLPKRGTRFHFHSYSSETVATIQQIFNEGKLIARLKLDIPLQLVAGDRFILRRFSPVTTVGGGIVLDPLPNTKQKLHAGGANVTLQEWIAGSVEGLNISDLVARTGRAQNDIAQRLKPLMDSGQIGKLGEKYFTQQRIAESYRAAEERLKLFHVEQRLAAGMNANELRADLKLDAAGFADLVAGLEKRGTAERSGELIRLRGAGVKLDSKESDAMRQITSAFANAGLKVPALPDVLSTVKIPRAEATKIVTLLLRDRTLIKLGDDLVFHRDALATLKPMLADYSARTQSNSIDVAGFKELTGISRKYAIPLLEHLDRERVTRRDGNRRIIL